KGTIDPATLITAPIAGTIVQRKVGPGQYVGSGSTDPGFIIGDLSTVWVVAFFRGTEAPMVHNGPAIYFTVLAYPDRSFPANISYVAAALDPTTRRLLVRATVNNSAGLLKPEMFASVKILTGEGDKAVAVPRDAIIYEGEAARVWVVRDKDSEKAIELRRIKVGLTNGNMVEVLKGLAPSDRVVTKGSLFIDRVGGGRVEGRLQTERNVMNGIVAFSLKQRVPMVLLFVMILFGGVIAFRELNIEAYPDPTPPMVDVITQSPGLSAEEIERYITIPIEVNV